MSETPHEMRCPPGVRRVFGFPDIHWAIRDPVAMAVAVKAHANFKPDLTVFGGDLVDAGPFARHPRMKYGEGDYDFIREELEPLKGFLDGIQKRTTRGRLAVVLGNHDDWVERWSLCHGMGTSLKGLRPVEYLLEGRPNTQVVPYGRLASDSPSFYHLHPSLIVVHGWAANKYAAATHLVRGSPYSVIFNHTHRMQSETITRCDGSVVQAMSAGCLTKKVPVYAHGGSPTGWVHGFWVAYLGRESYTLYSVVIDRGQCVLPDGTLIRA